MTVAEPAATVRAVLLDMDGTLIRSEHVHRAIWRRFFDAWQVDVDDERYARSVMGRRARDVLAQMPGPWRAEDLPAVVAGLHADVDAAAQDVAVVDGAVELVRELRQRGYRLAVVTSAGREWALRVLDDVLGVADALDVVVTAEEVEVGKPSPEGYLRACRRLGVAPAACVAVEDAPSGVRALVAAGVRTVVGITTTASARELRDAGAAATVPNLRPALTLPALGLP
jgi:mannitol-1-/sugar-/sorbitol-6-phosphatase